MQAVVCIETLAFLNVFFKILFKLFDQQVVFYNLQINKDVISRTTKYVNRLLTFIPVRYIAN